MKQKTLKEILIEQRPLLKKRGEIPSGARLSVACRSLLKEARRVRKKVQNKEELTSCERWISDNAALLVQKISPAAKEKRVPRGVYLFCRAVFSAWEGVFSKEEVYCLFDALGAECLSHASLLSVRPALLLAGAEVLLECVREGADPSRFVRSLHRLCELNFSAAVLSASGLDAVLRRDPAEAYPKMSEEYRLRLCEDFVRASRRARREAEGYAEDVLEEARRAGDYVGNHLPEKRACAGLIYSLFVGAFTLLFSCVLSVWLSREYPFSAAALLGFLLAGQAVSSGVISLFDALFSRFVRAPLLWRIRLDTLPKEAATMVVYTLMARDEEEVREACGRLEQAYFASFAQKERHLRFALLLDLPESRQECAEEDAAVLAAAREGVFALSERFGGAFYLFWRARTQTSEGVWRGWERKRGAILSLVSFLVGRAGELRCLVGDPAGAQETRYVLTLDGDTVLTPGALHELVGILEHPKNRAVLCEKDGVCSVKRGYGILQPRIAASAASGAASPFSALKTGFGGMGAYESAAFDRAQSLFSHGHFCGKGLFSVAVFDAVLQGAYPDERILSHDLLEGARLSCAAATDVVLLDEAPSGARVASEREHRWCRGDVQALFFSGFRATARDGVKRRNPMAFYYRTALWDNLRRALTSVVSALLILISVFVSPVTARLFVFAALFGFAASFAVDVLCMLAAGHVRGVFRSFSSPLAGSLWQRFLNVLYDTSALFWEAYLHADAILRALWRMCVSHRRTLEWKTASESAARGADGLLSYLKRRFICLVSGVFLLLFSPFSVVRIVGFLSVLHPFVAFFVSRKFREKRKVPAKGEAEDLLEYVRAGSRFFLEEVGEHTAFLPPDHVTVSPISYCALRTSPTNVGLYLLSLCAMADTGVLEVREVIARLEQAICSVEKLPKWHGLLYNWYELPALSVLGEGYVSSVDCGNFIASLQTLSGFLSECEARGEEVKDLVARVRALIEASDLRPLYQSEKDLFSIGYNTSRAGLDDSHYDQYMSEARLTSYLAVAKGQVPLRHWRTLSRPVLQWRGRLGMASFSGTAFEYFMPCLFLPIGRASFESEALCTAALLQRAAAKKTRLGEVFGVSESAFFASDAIGDYPYRANGIARLALRGDSAGEEIISPYSSFLMLPVLGEGAVQNLRRLRRLGLYGKYGFYEAAQVKCGGVDVVQSYFAHHTGMSIVAAVNCLTDGAFHRRFLADPALSAMQSLTQEQIPAEARVFRAPAVAEVPSASPECSGLCRLEDGREGALVLQSSALSLSCGFDGTLSVLWRQDGGLLLFRPEQGERGGLALYALVDGVLYSTLEEANPKDALRRLELLPDGVRFSVSRGGVRVLFSVCLSHPNSALSCRCEVFGQARRIRAFLSVSPLFSSEKAYFAHPAFRALSLSFRRTEKGVFVFARQRGGREYVMTLSEERGASKGGLQTLFAEEIADLGGVCGALFSRFVSGKREGILSPPQILVSRTLEPSVRGGGTQHCFVLGIGESPSMALAAAEGLLTEGAAEKNSRRDRMLSLRLRAMESAGLFSLTDAFSASLTHAVLSARRVRTAETKERFLREELYAHSVSGDLPIVFCRVGKGASDRIDRLCALYRYHAICALSYDLVFFSEAGGYERAGLTKALSAVRAAGAEYLLSRAQGGIFLIEGTARDGALFECAACASFATDGTEIFLPPPPKRERWSVPNAAAKKPSSALGARFTEEGFLLEKDVYDPPEQFAWLLASETFGALVTHRSLGFSFETSSRFRRLSQVENDAFLNAFGERLFLSFDDGARHDLAAESRRVLFSLGSAEYFGRVRETDYHLTVFSHPVLLFRGVRAEFSGKDSFSLSYELVPVLGDENGVLGAFTSELREGVLVFSRAIGSVSRPFSGFLCLKGAEPSGMEGAFSLSCRLDPEEEKTISFYLGAKESEKQFAHVLNELEVRSFSELMSESVSRTKRRLPKPIVERGEGEAARARSAFLNTFLPQQVLQSRLLARCGLYQAGGAYGFRDQLQDALFYLTFAPEKCAVQILRHAAHQFAEGDVLHWWHNLPDGSGRHRGVRTHICDDYLWLVYAACRYVEVTRDAAFLERKVPFLQGRALKAGERDLYDAFAWGEKASLWEHLFCAADLFLRRGRGAHGLAYMLAGDWNDGFDNLGEGAESVFVSQFGTICLLRLCRLMETDGRWPEKCTAYRRFAEALSKAVSASFCGRWYTRAYFGDGEALGADLSLRKPCSIDLLTQAFAAFCFLESERDEREREHVFSALEAVWEHLYEQETGVLKLFAPPFDTRGREVGYIRAYASGVRENGGQYTHAAVWYAMACRAMAPFSDDPSLWLWRADTVMEGLLPYTAAYSAEKRDRYRLEPYALAGDVYAAKGELGRGGWNHYTGSAAWAWRYYAEGAAGLPPF